MSSTRKGPSICNNETTIRENLRNVFGFTDALYSEHVYSYPLQTEVSIQPTILSHARYIDVNYKWSTEYYHFLTEVLPNVLFLHKKYSHIPILCKKSPFTERMFRWFGVKSDIIEHKLPAKTRTLATFVECGNPSPEKIHLIRSVVESKVTFESTHGILIRRHKTRYIENEDELFEECKEKFPHLKWVIFDTLTPDDTAQLFSKAEVIVAPHGAGLTNMIFSKRGVSIYEFMPLDEPNLCYWHLSEVLGNSYTMIPVEKSALNSMKCNLHFMQ
jgi:hypothetical protein